MQLNWLTDKVDRRTDGLTDRQTHRMAGWLAGSLVCYKASFVTDGISGFASYLATGNNFYITECPTELPEFWDSLRL